MPRRYTRYLTFLADVLDNFCVPVLEEENGTVDSKARKEASRTLAQAVSQFRAYRDFRPVRVDRAIIELLEKRRAR